jgi:hypothetical protein
VNWREREKGKETGSKTDREWCWREGGREKPFNNSHRNSIVFGPLLYTLVPYSIPFANSILGLWVRNPYKQLMHCKVEESKQCDSLRLLFSSEERK